jgi:magnesium transporter
VQELIQFEMNKEFIERFQLALNTRDDAFIRQVLEEVNPADISTLLYEFNSEESKYVIDLLPVEKRAAIINDLDPVIRKGFIKNYTNEEIIDIIDVLDSDDAVDILNELSTKIREEVLAGLDEEWKAQIIDLLRYDEDVAGGLMAKEILKANVNWTVIQCIAEIRKQAENVTKIYSVYVVDDKDILLGRVSLKKLILSEDNTRIEDIYEKDIISVQTYFSDRDVAEIMRKYDLESVPVLNVQGQLLGRITIDDIVDVITEQAEEDRQIMSGISENVEEDDSVWRISRARLPWLIIGIFGGLLSARFIGVFESDLLRVTAIAFFIPLIQATGGNVGIQSSSIVVQSLVSPGGLRDESMWKRLMKVFIVALLNGFILSLLVFGFNLLLGGDFSLSVVVSVALFSVVVIASFIGTITPLILNHFGFNPALASGPFITTTNDLLGLAIYFFTIHLLLWN